MRAIYIGKILPQVLTMETKSSLASKFGISRATLAKRLKNIPGLKLKRNAKIITPKQLELIYNELGKPRENERSG